MNPKPEGKKRMCENSTAFRTGELKTCCNYGLLFSAVMRIFLHNDFHQTNLSRVSTLRVCDLKTRTAAINVYRAHSISVAKNDGRTSSKKNAMHHLANLYYNTCALLLSPHFQNNQPSTIRKGWLKCTAHFVPIGS